MSKLNHPYLKYENSRIWKIVDAAISDLVENGDVVQTTRREYIVGYLIKKLERIKGMPEKAFQQTARGRSALK